jgi:hypothetical protein
MNELFQNFDIVISDNNMDIRNFLVLFASGTAGHALDSKEVVFKN